MHPEISPIATGMWYMVGVLMRVIWRWAGWVTKQDNRQSLKCWARYWKTHLAENVMQVIFSIVVMFVWTQGLLWVVTKQLGIEVPHFAITGGSSIAAGFTLSMLIHKYVASKYSPK